MKFDARRTLSRAQAREVYDGFARKGHIGGRDTSSGYGGPAVQALLTLASFANARSVFEFGCGQAKLAQLVLKEQPQLVNFGDYDKRTPLHVAARHLVQLDASPNGVLADLGAGTGRCAATCALLRPDVTCHSFELVAGRVRMAQRARRRLGRSCTRCGTGARGPGGAGCGGR